MEEELEDETCRLTRGESSIEVAPATDLSRSECSGCENAKPRIIGYTRKQQIRQNDANECKKFGNAEEDDSSAFGIGKTANAGWSRMPHATTLTSPPLSPSPPPPPPPPPPPRPVFTTHTEKIILDGDAVVACASELEPYNGTSNEKVSVMASPRSKSPRPPNSSRKDEKEESFWEKIGTLGRKKRIKEVQEVQEEGKYAIDSPGYAANPDMPPEEYALEENEERSMIEPRALEDSKLKELIFVLIEWINDELADQRIIVKDIAEDLYDGQVLQKLIEKLTGEKLDVPEVTQSEEGQKQKLEVVLSVANTVLRRYPPYKWSVESVHSRDIVAVLHLLVGLARQFRAPVRLPERVAVQLVVVRKKDGQLTHRTVREEITSTYDDLGMRCERDAFDVLFDHPPEKLTVVKKSLVSFVNKHLSKVHLEVTDLDGQFHDGVFLTLLLGLLEGFFVPLGSFHLTPKTHDQKVHNVSFAFDLMQDVGLPKPKARPEDIVNLDLKSTLRVLYNLFTKYKGVN